MITALGVEQVAQVDCAEEGGPYRLRHLTLFDPADQPVGERTFQDLLIHQLAEEVTELVARGLHRAYLRRAAWLESPRGQLDFQQMTRQAGGATAALPCIHHRVYLITC